MPILVIDQEVVYASGVLGAYPRAVFAAQTPRLVALKEAIVDITPAAAAWAASDPASVSFSGVMTITPVSARMSFFTGGSGVPVAADGGTPTVADRVRGGFAPVVRSAREPLFPTDTATLVTGLKDTNTPGQQRRTITMEEF